jgi:hypothetical protein
MLPLTTQELELVSVQARTCQFGMSSALFITSPFSDESRAPALETVLPGASERQRQESQEEQLYSLLDGKLERENGKDCRLRLQFAIGGTQHRRPICAHQ